MKPHRVTACRFAVWATALPLSLWLAGSGLLSAQELPPLPAAETLQPQIPQGNVLPPVEGNKNEDEGQAMLRGPVHEAFAEQVNADPLPGMVISAKPPEPIEELPPEVRPDGRTVEWISGYWAWDEDRNDFMWVSGIWREVPQGFRWLPGYWTEVDGGFQWVAGTWVSTRTAELQYIETAPPQSLEQGPAGVPPTIDHIWIPGCWSWQDTRYAWRPGYWSVGYTNWLWVPARYYWTPRGYYYCNGYWDYPLERRGVLFAPCYFAQSVYVRPGFRFTPQVVVSTGLLQVHFWVRPQYQHYYFGDYYNAPYAGRGMLPWHHYHRQHHGVDPLFCHYSRGRGNQVFYNQVNTQFNVFLNNPDRRPSHTFREQDHRVGTHGNGNHDHSEQLGARLDSVVRNSAKSKEGLQFVKLETDQRQRLQRDAEDVRSLAGQRRTAEMGSARSGRHSLPGNDLAGSGAAGPLVGAGPGGARSEAKDSADAGSDAKDSGGDASQSASSQEDRVSGKAEHDPQKAAHRGSENRADRSDERRQRGRSDTEPGSDAERQSGGDSKSIAGSPATDNAATVSVESGSEKPAGGSSEDKPGRLDRFRLPPVARSSGGPESGSENPSATAADGSVKARGKGKSSGSDRSSPTVRSNGATDAQATGDPARPDGKSAERGRAGRGLEMLESRNSDRNRGRILPENVGANSVSGTLPAENANREISNKSGKGSAPPDVGNQGSSTIGSSGNSSSPGGRGRQRERSSIGSGDSPGNPSLRGLGSESVSGQSGKLPARNQSGGTGPADNRAPGESRHSIPQPRETETGRGGGQSPALPHTPRSDRSSGGRSQSSFNGGTGNGDMSPGRTAPSQAGGNRGRGADGSFGGDSSPVNRSMNRSGFGGDSGSQAGSTRGGSTSPRSTSGAAPGAQAHGGESHGAGRAGRTKP